MTTPVKDRRSPEGRQRQLDGIRAYWASKTPEDKRLLGERVRAKLAGIPRTLEVRMKISQAHKGKPKPSPSAETRAVLSVAVREGHRKRRAEMTDAERLADHAKRSEAVRQSWALIPPDKRSRLTEEGRIAKSEATRQRMHAMTPEQAAEHGRKISSGLKQEYATHTAEERQTRFTPEWRARQSKRQMGWFSRLSVEEQIRLKQTHSMQFKAYYATVPKEQRVQKASRAAKILWAALLADNDGDMVKAQIAQHIQGVYHSEKMQNDIPFESSYEKRAFEILEQLTKVQRYGRCIFGIRYQGPDGLLHWYFPDIFVEYTDGTVEIIEVKPKAMMDNPIVKAKAKAAVPFCEKRGWNYVFWTERKLKRRAA